MSSLLYWLLSAWRRRSPPQASLHSESFEKLLESKMTTPTSSGSCFFIREIYEFLISMLEMTLDAN